jgi:hypothetical protein
MAQAIEIGFRMSLRCFGRNRVNDFAGLVQEPQVRSILVVYHQRDAILADAVGDGESSGTIGSFPDEYPVSSELATRHGLLHLLAFGLFLGSVGHALNRPHLVDKNIRRSFRPIPHMQAR